LTESRGPFADVDLLLVTHSHADHFNAKLVTAHLRNDTRCRLIASAETVDHLRNEEGFAQIQDRIRKVTLAAGTREHVSVNGMEVDVLCLGGNDGSDPSDPTSRLTFVINLNGVRFFHLGDDLIEQNEARLAAFPFDRTPVDILFLRRDDLSAVAQQFIARKIKPSRTIAMHVPPAQRRSSSPVGLSRLTTTNIAHQPSLPTAAKYSGIRPGHPGPTAKRRSSFT
jgi:L-ascorbate metabolism protein UlaG (beta-lactamase superfamily)